VALVPSGKVIEMSADHTMINMSRRQLGWLLAATAGYVAMSLIANVLSIRQVRILLAVDAGTLTYPLTFTLRDLIHKAGGVFAARIVVVATAVMNTVLALSLWVATLLPPDLNVGTQKEFGNVLLSAPRIIAASIVTQLVAELADTEVYSRWMARFGSRLQLGRVLSSNAVSVPLDSVMFTVLAFGGTLDRSTVIEIIIANIVIKGVWAMVFSPMIYLVRDFEPQEVRGNEPAALTSRG
jgi:uncharacterized integral membrane protein (TIGR00697 family)